jgi:penicillin-binding protein 2
VIDPIHERRTPMPPQMAMRVAVLGVVAFALFAIIFFRLWYLQVLSGEQYLRQAQVNKVRTERIAAPRGEIKDRNGNRLVVNEQATVITLDPRRIPDVEKELAAKWGKDFAARERLRKRLERERNAKVRELRAAGRERSAARVKKVKLATVRIPPIPDAMRPLFRDLGRVIGMRPSTIQERVILGLWLAPYAPVKIKTGVADDVRDFLYERPDRFPGVLPQQTYLRSYPDKNLAAQIFGTVGSISQEELDSKEFKGATGGEIVGQGGLERRYDADLRGRDGLQRFLVDAQGNPKGSGQQRPPTAGRSLKLTLDKGLQAAGQVALARNGGGRPGGFVAMNPNSGAIYALGSYPSYDPNLLAKPITKQRYDAIFSEAAGSPAVNRAITGAYPTGSTFKPFTALAALKAGIITPATAIPSPPCVTIAKQPFCNAGKASLGTPDLVEALKVSADVYFYRLGQWTNDRQGQLIQSMARKFGFDHRTGIDVPGEFGGTIPDRQWRRDLNEKERAYEKKHGNVCPPDCVYSDKREWTVGDTVQVAVGQGDLQATPLQMAVAYAALANGGRVVRPHLGMQVDDPSGRLIRRIRPGAARRVKIDPTARAAILAGLHAAASAPGGTSTDVFKGWPQDQLPVFGKTGTAQRAGRPDDQSWYVAFVPGIKGDASKPPIVIAATIEDAGFGADAAAPAVCEMLSHWYRVKDAACAPGASHTR